VRPKGSADELERRRQRAIVLVLEHGYSSAEAAIAVGAGQRSINRWLSAYRDAGNQGIAPIENSGRPALLNNRQLSKLEKFLLKGPLAAGFGNDLWTCERVAALIDNKFGINFHRSHVWRILRELGWTPQKPERRAIERDEKGIERFIKYEWKKAVKKHGKRKPP
jgi:transposase